MSEGKLVKIVKFGVYAAMLTPLVYIPQTIFGTVFGKMIYFQIAVELALPFYVFLIFFYKQYRPQFSRLTKLIILLFAALFISSLLGVDFEKSFWGYPSRMRGLFSLLHFLAVYFYIISVFRQDREKKNLLLFIIFVGFFVALYGILERINPEWSVDKVAVKSPVGHRVLSTTGNPIFLAGYMVFLAFLAIHFVLKNSGYGRWAALATAPIFVLVIFFTETRAAFLGLIAGGIATAFYLFFIFEKRQKVILASILIVVFTLLAAVLIFDFKVLKKNRFWNISRITDISFNSAEGSTTGRLLLWKTSFAIFKERPVFGWGLENFEYGFDKHYRPEFLRNGMGETWADRAHNLFLDLLTMSGLIGLGAFVAILIYVSHALLKRDVRSKANGALFGVLAAFGGYGFFSVDSPSVTLMLFIFLALIHLIIYDFRPFVSEAPHGLQKMKKWQTVVAFGLSLPLIYFCNLKPLYAGIRFIDFKNFSGSASKRVGLAEYFLKNGGFYADDLRLRFANEIFYGAAKSGDAQYIKWGMGRAMEEIKKASANHPQDFAYYHTLGNLYLREASIGNDSAAYDKAIEYYKRALSLSPKRQAVMFQLATAYIFDGQTKEAVDILEKAVEYDNGVGQSHWRLGIAYLANGQRREAYDSFKKSLALNHYGTIVDEMKTVAALCEEFKDSPCIVRMAAKIYENKISDNPKDLEALKNLANAYAAAGEYGQAREMIMAAVKLEPSLRAEAEVFLRQIGY